MNASEHLAVVACPACWGRGHQCLLDTESPDDWPCERCDRTGLVTPEHAEEMREEAGLFVAKCAVLAEVDRMINDFFDEQE